MILEQKGGATQNEIEVLYLL